MVVGGRIGAEGQAVLAGGPAQGIEHAAGLYPSDAPVGIDVEDGSEVPGPVDDDRLVGALPRHRRPSAAVQDRDAGTATERHSADGVVDAAGAHHTEGDLAVVGGVGRVQRPSAAREVHVTVHGLRQVRRQTLEGLQVSRRGGGHPATRYGSASACLSSRPRPGRERSGRSTPSVGSRTPSKRMRSSRAWSAKYSRWRMLSTDRAGWR